MGKKCPNTFRTTISVPRDLKRRMGKLNAQVNWSALACQAFEDKLAEIVKSKEVKDMNDVVERLRASRRCSDNQEYQEGMEEGRWWAEHRAEALELERLEAYRAGWESQSVNNWDWFLSDEGSSAYTMAEHVFFGIHPEHDKDQSEAETFWEAAVGSDVSIKDRDGEYLRGFAEGALNLWHEVKAKL